MSKDELKKEFNRLYNVYTEATYAAYQSEGHFYANKPISKELEEKRMEAYRAFDKVRKEYLKVCK